MRTFTCDVCDALVLFENSVCLASDTPLGYSSAQRRMVALAPDADGNLVFEGPGGVERQCGNRDVAACNWLAEPGWGPLCRSCELTRTRPADGDATGLTEFAVTEQAKRRLVYQLLDLGLPVISRAQDPARGLAFDLLSSEFEPVTTGHADGVITIDLAEGDDPHREAMRVQLDEPYRTVLGHLRHETGHYYWQVLIDGTPLLDPCRELFGDDSASYADAVQRHYDHGAPDGWERDYVSSYATMHPWEDWAETFAHYLHQRDTLQTAAEAGIVVLGPRAVADPAAQDLAAVPRAAETGGIEQQVATWLPLTYALNAVNRSMGKEDLYPFVLTPAVIRKLGFVHEAVTGRREGQDVAGAAGTGGSVPSAS